MDFGSQSPPAQPLSRAVIQASTALHAQVCATFTAAGQTLDDAGAWARVGITPMIGQNDVASEQFTLADAAAVNHFARAHGVGQLSMWSLNRDSTCGPPCPRPCRSFRPRAAGLTRAPRASPTCWRPA